MSQSLLTLPNLFIPGAAKSGTSTLHDYLSLHPDINMSVNKEPNYYWREDKRLEHYAKLYAGGRYRYLGESSTNYMVLPEVVDRIRKTVSDPRFIFNIPQSGRSGVVPLLVGQRPLRERGKELSRSLSERCRPHVIRREFSPVNQQVLLPDGMLRQMAGDVSGSLWR